MARDKLLRLWTPAFTVIDICWMLLFASLPVLVVTSYHAEPADPRLALRRDGRRLTRRRVRRRCVVVRKVEALTLGAAAFTLEMASLWILAIPAPWFVAFTGMALAGFFTSLVNTPVHALITLRIPREIRTQALASFGVFQCIGAPIGLLLAGPGARALRHAQRARGRAGADDDRGGDVHRRRAR